MTARKSATSPIPRDLTPLLRQIAAQPELTALYEQAAARLTLGAADYATALELCRLTGLSSLGAHALLLCMFITLDDGAASLPLTPTAIAARLQRFLEGDTAEQVAAVLKAAQSELAPLIASASVATAPAEFKPLIRAGARAGEARLYFQRYHAAAERLRQALTARLHGSAPEPAASAAALQAATKAVILDRPVRRAGTAVMLEPRQQWALAVGLLQNLSFIAGGPGTGKTAIVTALVRALLELGLPPGRMALAAPTGRAARRMTESLRRDWAGLVAPTAAETAAADLGAMTLHRLLDYDRGSNRFRRHRFNPLPVDAVLVDEVSMIDVRLMAALFDATPATARLILIGDPDQLPPVDVGEVLADLLRAAPPAAFSPAFAARVGEILPPPVVPAAAAPAGTALPASAPPLTDRLVKLEHNFRAVDALQAAAREIQAGATTAFQRIPCDAPDTLFAADSHGAFWLPADDPAQPTWPAIVDQWLKRQYLTAGPGNAPTYFQRVEQFQRLDATAWLHPDHLPLWQALFERLESVRLLTALRQGPFGCDTINRFAAARLQQLRGRRRPESWFAGLPLLIRQNDDEADLFNGDVGVWMRDRAGLRLTVFREGAGFRLLPAAALPVAEPALAMTVHKSQGSEFDRVLIALPGDADHRLLRRDLLYTAVTRARHSAVIYATQAALQAAAARAPAADAADHWWSELAGLAESSR